ncbi:MAG: lysophospholipid acyltransferase family protein [Chloroflexota bacterium]
MSEQVVPREASVASTPNAKPSAKPRTEPAAPRRGTVGQRIRAFLIALLSWIACRLPERLTIAVAEVAGEVWYRAAPARAAQGRRNLARVCTYLAERGMGDERVRAAAVDPKALERLLRSAFRHAARYYLEVTRTPGMTPATIRERLLVETPETVDEAFAGGRPVIFVALHFGAIELPALFLAERTRRRAVVPMETVGDPELQRWFVRTRGGVGLRIVGLREARRELLAALQRGESVGLVADRDLTGGGIPVPFFGSPAPLPIGPPLLAMETGAPIYLAAVRRDSPGRYRGRLVHVPVAEDGDRRTRLTTTLSGLAERFEQIVADAPDQWWSIFFPIWPDLAGDKP